MMTKNIRDYDSLKIYLNNPHIMQRITFCFNKDCVTAAIMKSKEMSFKEIAQKMGVQTATVRNRVAAVLDHIEYWLDAKKNPEERLLKIILAKERV